MGGTYQDVYYDQSVLNLINSVSYSVVDYYTPQVNLNETHSIIRLRVYEDAPTKSNCAALVMEARIGNEGSPALVVSNSSSFNSNADWSNVSAQTGDICYYMNTASVTLNTDLSGSRYKTYYTTIYATDGDGDQRIVANFPIKIFNTVD